MPDEGPAQQGSSTVYTDVAVAELAKMGAPYNPRRISDHDLNNLRRSLRFYGTVQPVVVNRRTWRVVGGHQRIKAAQLEGMETLPVVYVDLDEPTEKQLNLTLNRTSGSWDVEKLQAMLQELDTTGADMTLTGFDDQELGDMLKGWDSDFELPGDGDGNAGDELRAVFRVSVDVNDGPSVFEALEKAVEPYGGAKVQRL